MSKENNTRKPRAKLASPARRTQARTNKNGDADAPRTSDSRYGTDKTIAEATVVIAVATIVTIVVAGLQLCALWQAEATTRSIQRPFVTASKLSIEYDGKGYWFFRVLAQNSGNTPTKNLRYILTASQSPSDPGPIFNDPPGDVSIFRSIIGPKTTTNILGLSGLPATTIEKLANGRSNWYLYGVFHYQDWFNDRSHYATKFCFAAIPFIEGDKVRVSYEPCIYWNCADDECETDSREYQRELKKLNPQLQSND